MTAALHEQVVGALDELDVTDTVFHDLKHSAPLAAEILARVPAGARRVLVIGPNIAVVHVLAARGADVRVWHIRGVALTEALMDKVDRRGSLDELLRGDDDGSWDEGGRDAGEPFDAVVAPYLLELAAGEPVATLRALRALVRPAGTVVVVADRAGALSARWHAARGRSLSGRRRHPGSSGTWTWPTGPSRRTVDEQLLRAWARSAGLRVAELARVVDRAAVEAVSAVAFGPWVGRQAQHGLRRCFPSLRDTAVATLVPLEAGRADDALGPDPGVYPRVTVVVAGSERGRLSAVLADLENQTYPRARTELVLLWPAAAGPFPNLPGTLTRRERVVDAAVPSPEAATVALDDADGDVIAWTSDMCAIPPGWVESGVRSLGNWNMAVAGRVLVGDGSAAAFLDLPGRRRYPRPDGTFSWTNSFYVRQALVEVGGFRDPDGHRAPGGRPTWGWDSTAALELVRRGYHVREANDVYLHRIHPHPVDRSWIREEYEEARGIPHGVAHAPALARALHHRHFATRRTLAFDVMVAGAVASLLTRRPLPAVAGVAAYARAVSEYVDIWPPDAWRTSARHMRGVVLRNTIWFAGLAHGSLRARRFVL